MKAAFITETGSPEVIRYGDLPTPEPGPTEVLVKVGAVAVNPIDTYIRSGNVAIPIEFPYIVGCDLAGTVEQCGTDVTQFQPGDRVWGSNQSLSGRKGTFAEYAAVDQFLTANGMCLEDIDGFAIHPGGAKVVDALEQVFGLDPGALVSTRDVLRDFGNMSAVTVLFVLEHMLAQAETPDRILMSSLGPGFTAGFLTLERT